MEPPSVCPTVNVTEAFNMKDFAGSDLAEKPQNSLPSTVADRDKGSRRAPHSLDIAMTDEEIFNDYTMDEPDLGPRFDPARASTWFQNRMRSEAEDARKMIRDAAAAAPKMPPIHFDWIHNEEINACAFAHQRMYFVGVNAGTSAYLHSLFSRMLSHPRILPDIGNAANEDENRVPPTPLRIGKGELVAANFIPVIPKDPERRYVYEYLTRTAFKFLIGHEITHLIHGHIAYKEDRFGQRGIRELGWKKRDPEPPLTRQTLEMDADMGATALQVAFVMLAVENVAKIKDDLMARFFKSPEQAMYYLALGISPFFRMFGDEPVPAADADVEMYPPWRVRLLIATATACNLVSQLRNHELAVACQNKMRDAIVLMERAYCDITGEPMATRGLTQAFEGSGWQHVQDKLLTHWRDELRAELLPFSFVPLSKGDDAKYGWKDGKWTQVG
jgi:hypothetical protein